MRTDAIRPRIAQPAEARSCFCYTVACHGGLAVWLSDLLSLEKHRPAAAAKNLAPTGFSPDMHSVETAQTESAVTHLNGIWLAGRPTTRTCVPLANISKPHELPLLTSFYPAQLRPFSGLLLGKESKKKETRRIPSPLLPDVHSPNCPLCPRRTGCECLVDTGAVDQKHSPNTYRLVGKRKVKC